MARTKTFKIGEYAIGGIIKVTIKGKIIILEALDWNSKKVIATASATTNHAGLYRMLDNVLITWTSSYYTDKIIKWINPEQYQTEEYLV